MHLCPGSWELVQLVPLLYVLLILDVQLPSDQDIGIVFSVRPLFLYVLVLVILLPWARTYGR